MQHNHAPRRGGPRIPFKSSIVPTPNRDTSNIPALITFLAYITPKPFITGGGKGEGIYGSGTGGVGILQGTPMYRTYCRYRSCSRNRPKIITHGVLFQEEGGGGARDADDDGDIKAFPYITPDNTFRTLSAKHLGSRRRRREGQGGITTAKHSDYPWVRELLTTGRTECSPLSGVPTP